MAVTEDRTGYMNKIVWTWTSTSAGAYTEATAYRYNGVCHKLITVPTDPTALYDVTITDADGVDVLGGAGADRSATLQESKAQSDGLGDVKSSILTLNVASAGDIKSGKTILYIYDVDKP